MNKNDRLIYRDIKLSLPFLYIYPEQGETVLS